MMMEGLERKVALIEQDARGLGPDTMEVRRGLEACRVDVLNSVVYDGAMPSVSLMRIIEPGTARITKPVFKNNSRLRGRFINGVNGRELAKSGLLESWSERFADGKITVDHKNDGFSIDGLRPGLGLDDLTTHGEEEAPDLELWLPSDMRAATWTDSDGMMPDHPSDHEVTEISMSVCRGLPGPIITYPTVDSIVGLILAPVDVAGDGVDLEKRLPLCWPGLHGLLRTVLTSYGRDASQRFNVAFESVDLSDQATLALDGSSGGLVTVGMKISTNEVVSGHHMVKTYQTLSKVLDGLLFTMVDKIGESYSFIRIVPIMSGVSVLNHALTDHVDGVPSVDVHTVDVDADGNLSTFCSDGKTVDSSITGEMMDSITRLVKSIGDSVESMRGDAGKINAMMKSGSISSQLALTVNPLVNDVLEMADKISGDLGSLRSLDSYRDKTVGGSTIESIRNELVVLKDLQARSADYEADSRLLLRTVQGWSPLPGDAAITLARSIDRLREIEGSRPIGYDQNKDG